MGIQEVQGSSKTQTYQKKKNAGRGEGFQESLLQNLKCRDQERQSMAAVETEEKQTVTDVQTEVRTKAEKVGMGRIGAAPGIRVNAAAMQETLQAVEVRHMSYEESDHVRIAVTEGYTLKGKREEGVDARVYVEAKYEDGRVEAYQVELAKVQGQTEHVIERFALETMEEA
ncbi:MAG: hypothetical protein K2M20_10600 [Lachnospiraceae bacterium]|nr:hypothetical protein [Lachnospiraceae bacterium]